MICVSPGLEMNLGNRDTSQKQFSVTKIVLSKLSYEKSGNPLLACFAPTFTLPFKARSDLRNSLRKTQHSRYDLFYLGAFFACVNKQPRLMHFTQPIAQIEYSQTASFLQLPFCFNLLLKCTLEQDKVFHLHFTKRHAHIYQSLFTCRLSEISLFMTLTEPMSLELI